jgi:hypothetical protein
MLAQLGRECRFDCLSIRCRKLVLDGQRPVRPGDESFWFFKLLKLGDQLVPRDF